jgi:prevent-host-death family protein
MRKTINAVRARGQLGQILEEVYYRGDQYIIERAGKPMAAVVPIELFEQWQKAKEEVFAAISAVRKGNKGISPEVIAKKVATAVRAVRKK